MAVASLIIALAALVLAVRSAYWARRARKTAERLLADTLLRSQRLGISTSPVPLRAPTRRMLNRRPG